MGGIRDCGDIPVGVGKIERLGRQSKRAQKAFGMGLERSVDTHIAESVNPI